MSSPPARYFFKGQLLHLLLLTGLLVVTGLLVDFVQLSESSLLGVSTQVWFILALAVPIVHQTFVWVAWRSELCFGTVTRKLRTGAFVIYKTVFFVFFLARPLSLLLLAIADQDSVAISIPARVVVCTLLLIPAIYTLYSVVRYFGLSRAAGLDHFDKSYRDLPLVNKGVFRYISNSMYTLAFLLFWAIGVAGGSRAAIAVAFFSHAYIWVHYFCTERPDMQVIYGAKS